jgi:hypothetical protein
MTDQDWFWTDEWQAGEREADAQIAEGNTTIYYSAEEFFAALDAIEHDETDGRNVR